jgi:hypothetical protein
VGSRWAWCNRRSTAAVAIHLGMMVSNPLGWMLEVTATLRDSRLNQLTRIPWSMTAWASASQKWLLPVPEGPQMARFSARPTHSSVRSAVWDGGGMDDLSGDHDSKVLPAGSPAALRPGGPVSACDFLGQQDSEHFAGVPALGPGGGAHFGGGGAQVGQAHPP